MGFSGLLIFWAIGHVPAPDDVLASKAMLPVPPSFPESPAAMRKRSHHQFAILFSKLTTGNTSEEMTFTNF